MVNAKHIDDVGAPAVALGEFRRAATRMTASIRDTALGDGPVVAVPSSKASMASPAVKLSNSTDSTAPIVGTASITCARPAARSSAGDAGTRLSGSKRELKIATK
jgi:hypothetical protein